ncbi:hypothetical protein LTR36_004995 [Oleoguttula mirabilis]|uniref:F-box domain-containing protein n=1 Tax=Oleoguttula mirabilis TaxID=1507867 RepID=A0AAV9JVX2_9PEZI|nr:hypothetical protein LTR36_004995 [Oleoguttula mirabilis]
MPSHSSSAAAIEVAMTNTSLKAHKAPLGNAQTARAPPMSITSLPHELLEKILWHLLVPRKQLIILRRTDKCHCRCRDQAQRCHDPHREGIKRRRTNCGPLPSKLDCLLVSKTFYFAGVRAFYTGNALAFQTVPDLEGFIRHFGHDRKQAIRTVALTPRWCLDKQSDHVHALDLSNPDIQTVATPAGMPDQRFRARARQDALKPLDCLVDLPNVRRLIVIVKPCIYAQQQEGALEALKGRIEERTRLAWGREDVQLEFRYRNVLVEKSILTISRFEWEKSRRRRWNLGRAEAWVGSIC